MLFNGAREGGRASLGWRYQSHLLVALWAVARMAAGFPAPWAPAIYAWGNLGVLPAAAVFCLR